MLNADWTPLNVVQFRRALKLIIKNKAVVVKATEKLVYNAERTFSLFVPKIIRLVDYVKSLNRSIITFSRRNVLVRDRFTCAYCGKQGVSLTVDHVLPKSRGGKTDYENCVGACLECNCRKGDKTPDEAGMKLRVRPHKPTLIEFTVIRMKQLGIYEELDYGGIS